MRIYSRKVIRYQKTTAVRSELLQRYTQPRHLYLLAQLLHKLYPPLAPLFKLLEPPHRYLYDHLSILKDSFYAPICCQYEILRNHFAHAQNRIVEELLTEQP